MRKQKDITISEKGRDEGKVFRLTEMPASQAEKWAMRAVSAAARSGVNIPENITPGMGMQGIALLGIQAVLQASFIELEPLLDEMMTCIRVVPNPANPNIVRPLIEDDIEEVATRVTLRSEVIKLHVDFSRAGAL